MIFSVEGQNEGGSLKCEVSPTSVFEVMGAADTHTLELIDMMDAQPP